MPFLLAPYKAFFITLVTSDFGRKLDCPSTAYGLFCRMAFNTTSHKATEYRASNLFFSSKNKIGGFGESLRRSTILISVITHSLYRAKGKPTLIYAGLIELLLLCVLVATT